MKSGGKEEINLYWDLGFDYKPSSIEEENKRYRRGFSNLDWCLVSLSLTIGVDINYPKKKNDLIDSHKNGAQVRVLKEK